MSTVASIGLSLPVVMVALAALAGPAAGQAPPGSGTPAPGPPGAPPPREKTDTFMLRLCNHTTPDVFAAVVFKRGQDWVVQGWWTVPGNQCVNAVRAGYGWVYVYAESSRDIWPNQDN